MNFLLKYKYQNIPVWAYLLVVLVFATNILYINARLESSNPGFSGNWSGDYLVIRSIEAGGPSEAAGIKTGDTIQKMNGIWVTPESSCWHSNNYKPGETVNFELKRQGQIIHTSITYSSFWSANSGFYTGLYLLTFLISLLGLFILYKKPYDVSARLFFIYLQLFALTSNTTTIESGFFAEFISALFIVSFTLYGPVLIHFHLLFPGRSILIKKFRHLPAIFYTAGIITGALTVIFHLLFYYEIFPEISMIYLKLYQWSILWMGITLTIALAIAVYQYFTLTNIVYRRQLKLVIWGSVFGLFTPIAFGFFRNSFKQLLSGLPVVNDLETLLLGGSLIMILLILMAIFRYRMWNIELLIRKAILYTGTALAITLSYLFLLYIIDFLLITQTTLLRFLVLGISVIPFLALREYIQNIIDRLFFRQSYVPALVIKDFEEKISCTYQEDFLTEIITRELNDIFHFKHFTFFRSSGFNTFKSVISNGIHQEPIPSLTITEEFDDKLHKGDIFTRDDISNAGVLPDLFKDALIVPLTNNSLTSGFFICGMKKSEQSFSLDDIRLLSILASRISAQFQTAELYQKDLDRQLMLERERVRISRDMHDDIGASLTRISILSELAKNKVSQQENTGIWLEQIADTSRNVMEEMNQIIWALNPKNDTLQGLTAYLRRFACEYLEPTSVQLNFSLHENLPEIPLSVEVRRNIYLTVRECLHNIVKHAHATHVDIEIFCSGSIIAISITDNGDGFDYQHITTPGNGLINMKKRILEIGGEFELSTGQGQGTIICIKISF